MKEEYITTKALLQMMDNTNKPAIANEEET